MKKWKKAVTISVACLTGIGVLAGGLYESSLSVQAVDTFMAVRNMKSQYSVSDDTTVIASTFRVLEIADNQAEAELGNMAGGSEPFRAQLDAAQDQGSRELIYDRLIEQGMLKPDAISYANNSYTADLSYPLNFYQTGDEQTMQGIFVPVEYGKMDGSGTYQLAASAIYPAVVYTAAGTESVSGNSVSGNSVSGNSVSSNNSGSGSSGSGNSGTSTSVSSNNSVSPNDEKASSGSLRASAVTETTTVYTPLRCSAVSPEEIITIQSGNGTESNAMQYTRHFQKTILTSSVTISDTAKNTNTYYRFIPKVVYEAGQASTYQELQPDQATTSLVYSGYWKAAQKTVINTEWLKKYLFQASDAEAVKMQLSVQTIALGDYTADASGDTALNKDISAALTSANLIYLSADGRYTPKDDWKTVGTAQYRDLTKDAAISLLKTVQTNTIPLMWNRQAYAANTSASANREINLFGAAAVLSQISTDNTTAANYAAMTAAVKNAVSGTLSWNQSTFDTALVPKVSTVTNFVNGKTYCLNLADVYADARTVAQGAADEEKIPLFVNYSTNAVQAGLQDVYYRIEQENELREGKEESMGYSINILRVMQYLLALGGEAPAIVKTKLNVLELEPCRDYTYVAGGASTRGQSQSDLNKQFAEKYVPSFADDTAAKEWDNITITGMTTSEFAGRLDDLNESYDLIYIGSNTGVFNVDVNRNVRTYSNAEDTHVENIIKYGSGNSDIYGIAYLHTGQLIDVFDSKFTGLLRKNDGQYRASGNDILNEQKDQLINFLKAGYPILVADNFFLYNKKTGLPAQIDAGNSVRKFANGDKGNGILDTSSYVFQFVREALGKNNVSKSGETYLVNSWNDRTYANFLNEEATPNQIATYLNQPKLTLNLTQRPTEYVTTTDSEGVFQSASYLTKEADGKYYLNYEFTIADLRETSPLNAKYRVEMYLDSNSDGKFSKSTETYVDFTVTDAATGAAATNGQLLANKPYRIRKLLPEGFIGAIPWKLTAYLNQNTDVHTSATGITAVKPEQTTLKVLEIVPPGYNDGMNFARDLSGQDASSNAKKWKKMLESIPGYSIQVDEAFSNQLTDKNYFDQDTTIDDVTYKKGDFYRYVSGKDTTVGLANLYDYDMIIIGFKDMVNNIPSEEVINAILDYGNQGNSVLYTHDTTSWINNASNFGSAGDSSTMNVMIRDVSGLDRYGVTLFHYLTKFAENPIAAGEVQAVGSGTAVNQFLDTYRPASDIAFQANTDQTKMVAETQGVTWSGAGRNGAAGMNFGGPSGAKWNISTGSWNNVNTCARVNEGVIASYPYQIASTLTVAPTHSQYYQLDLDTDSDGDGEGDVVVWYTLASSNNGDWNDIYDMSPKDVRNNYYIYNRGNITYSGVGHSAVTGYPEMQLFINTMIASYRAGIHKPSVKIVTDATATSEISSDLLPYDQTLADTTANGNQLTYKLFYAVNDDNIVTSTGLRTISAFYSAETKDGTQKNYANEELATYDVTGGTQKTEVAYNALQSGHVYEIDIPITDEKAFDHTTFHVTLTTTVKNGNLTRVSEPSTDDLQVKKMELMDLD